MCTNLDCSLCPQRVHPTRWKALDSPFDATTHSGASSLGIGCSGSCDHHCPIHCGQGAGVSTKLPQRASGLC